jgi:hypothetical protein
VSISAFLAVNAMFCIGWLRINREYKTVKALSVDMTTVMTFGLIMLVCSNIVLVLGFNNVTCVAWQWLFGLGGILSIMSPLLKAFRIARVFNAGETLHKVNITDKMLLKTLTKAAIFECLICGAYSLCHEYYGGTSTYYNDDQLRIETVCNQHRMTEYFAIGSYVYFFLMLCTLAYYSYGTRKAFKEFKESRCVYFSSFMSLFCTLLTFAFDIITDDVTFEVLAQVFAVIIVVTSVLIIFYVDRIYRFYTRVDCRNDSSRNLHVTDKALKKGGAPVIVIGTMSPKPSSRRNSPRFSRRKRRRPSILDQAAAAFEIDCTAAVDEAGGDATGTGTGTTVVYKK